MCIKTIQSVILTHFPKIETEKHLLISFSGGPDSVFLVHALQTLYPSISLHLLYFNHQLRPEVDEDLTFITRFARDHRCSLMIRKIPVVFAARKRKLTIEQSGRLLRLQYIRHTLKLKGFSYCMLGHHNDDRIETFMFRLLKGSKAGLSSIKPCITLDKSKFLCRPLLMLYKHEIVAELSRLKKPYLIDASNIDLRFDRNKIRQSLDQLGKPINSQYKKQISSFIDFLGQSNTMLDRVSGWNDVPRTFNNSFVTYDLSSIHQDPFLIEWVVSSLFRDLKSTRFETEFSFNQGHVKAVSARVATCDESIYQLPSGYFCQVVKQVLYIVFNSPIKEQVVTLTNSDCSNFGFSVVIKSLKKAPQSLLSSPFKAYFSLNSPNTKITVRAGFPDDFFQPFDSSKRIPFRKIMSRLKIPKLIREVMPLFFFDNQLAWIPGYQISEAFRVTKETTEIICVDIKEIK